LLSDLTTLRLGGPAARTITVASTDELVDAVRAADASGEPVLIVGGGSNLVIADEGWPGVVVLVRSDRVDGLGVIGSGDATVTAQAGVVWDELVALTVREGLSGLAPMSGIPGLAGATPVQNVGAYGSEVADVIVELTVLDRQGGVVEAWTPERCGFGFRTNMPSIRSVTMKPPTMLIVPKAIAIRPIVFSSVSSAKPTTIKPPSITMPWIALVCDISGV